jgi:hypothetical protein
VKSAEARLQAIGRSWTTAREQECERLIPEAGAEPGFPGSGLKLPVALPIPEGVV